MAGTLVLRRLQSEDEAAFLRAYRSISREVPAFAGDYRDDLPFALYLTLLAARERGVGLPAGYVPSSFLFAFVGDDVVGRASIRHRLNEELLRIGGHIGVVVVPGFRRRGHATTILRLALDEARDRLRLTRVLITCDDDNIGSRTAIERNGGVLENVVTGPDLTQAKRRYWIDVRPA
jgi:predicted acetyltransferase